MIPKIIHYCWLSEDAFPQETRKYMDTWKATHPEYEIKRWSTRNFDVTSVPYVKEAYEEMLDNDFTPLFKPVEAPAFGNRLICYFWKSEVGFIELVNR